MWHSRYLNSEKGFFSELWYNIKRRCDKNSSYHKHHTNKRKVKIISGIRDRDHLSELWEKQKKLLGGPYCIYTGIKLTTKRSRGNGYSGRTLTNISVDRIDPRLPYQEDNIVFCSWEFNDRKAGVTIDDCKEILRVWKERNA
jgi:hypothetical protein